MQEQANNHSHECKCDGAKKIKSIEKKIDSLYSMIIALKKEISILRKAVNK